MCTGVRLGGGGPVLIFRSKIYTHNNSSFFSFYYQVERGGVQPWFLGIKSILTTIQVSFQFQYQVTVLYPIFSDITLLVFQQKWQLLVALSAGFLLVGKGIKKFNVKFRKTEQHILFYLESMQEHRTTPRQPILVGRQSQVLVHQASDPCLALKIWQKTHTHQWFNLNL